MLEILQELAGLNPEQAGYTIPAQPTAPPMAVPAQAPQGGFGLLGSLFGGQRQPTQGFEGIPQREAPTWREKISTILSPALMQIGAALMSPPAQRAAILGNLGSVVQAGQKALADDRAYRAQLAAWQKVYAQQPRAQSEYEFFMSHPEEYKIMQEIKKPSKERNPVTRNVQMGDQNVTQQYNFDTKEWETLGSGPKFAPQIPVTFVEPGYVGQAPPGARQATREPQPPREPARWTPVQVPDTEGKMQTYLLDRISGDMKPTSGFGKALPGKKGRLSQQQTIIPGIPPEAGGTLQSGGVAPAPPGEATFPTLGQPTPIGRTPDGKTVYQDAQGRKFIQR